MSILIDASTRVGVLGITGGYASRQTREMIAAGTNVVGGVSTGRGGEEVHGVPVHDSFADLMAASPIDAVALHVNPAGVKDALVESVEAGVRVIYAGTEGVPPHDSMYMRAFARAHDAWLIGPNSLGLITPGEAMLGGIPQDWCRPGRVGVISRSGTLCLFVVSFLTKAGIGQSTVCTIGGDQIIGRNPIDYLKEFDEDPETDAILMLSEVGGRKDYEVGAHLAAMTKPVVAMLVGQSAPPGRRMGHIGAVAGDADESAAAKSRMLAERGALVAETWHDLPALLTSVLPTT